MGGSQGPLLKSSSEPRGRCLGTEKGSGVVRDLGTFPGSTVPAPGDPPVLGRMWQSHAKHPGATTLCPLQALAPAIDWLDYLSYALAPLELADTEPVVVYGDTYLQQVSDLINGTDRR